MAYYTDDPSLFDLSCLNSYLNAEKKSKSYKYRSVFRKVESLFCGRNYKMSVEEKSKFWTNNYIHYYFFVRDMVREKPQRSDYEKYIEDFKHEIDTFNPDYIVVLGLSLKSNITGILEDLDIEKPILTTVSPSSLWFSKRIEHISMKKLMKNGKQSLKEYYK